MSNISSNYLKVEATSSWPSPAQDYYEGALDLTRALIPRPASTYVMRVHTSALAGVGICRGDEVVVDRAVSAIPGALIVVVAEGEHRIGIFSLIDGRAVLVTDQDQLPLTSAVEYFGVVTASIHHHGRAALDGKAVPDGRAVFDSKAVRKSARA